MAEAENRIKEGTATFSKTQDEVIHVEIRKPESQDGTHQLGRHGGYARYLTWKSVLMFVLVIAALIFVYDTSTELQLLKGTNLKLKTNAQEMNQKFDAVHKRLHALAMAGDESLLSTGQLLEIMQRKFAKELKQLKCDSNPVECLRLLPEPITGDSFHGASLFQISQSVFAAQSVTVEIKNYLDVPLSGYKLWIEYSLTDRKAPETIRPNRREVFTFKNGDLLCTGAFLYRLNGTDIGLHVFFHTGYTERWLAMAFLKNVDNPEMTCDAKHGDHLTTNPTACAATNESVKDPHEEINLNIHADGLHARGNITFSSRGRIILEIAIFGTAGNPLSQI